MQLAARQGTQVVAERLADVALDVIGGLPARETFAAVRDGGRYVMVVPEFWVPPVISLLRAGSRPSS